MQILTWNINGIRATKEPLKRILDRLDADIICLQETKVTRDQLDEMSTIVDGYNSYFSFSKVRSGYSGVATFVKDHATPVKAEDSLSGILQSSDDDSSIGHYGNQSNFSDEELQALDREGRTVITQHKYLNVDGEEELLTVINVYCPRADPENEERKAFKIRFYELLQLRAETILGEKSHVIVLGDINTAHRPIDHCDPDETEFFKNPGRKWLTQFLCDNRNEHEKGTEKSLENISSGHKFVDTFRHFHPDQPSAFTCWATVTGARATNYGTRIDYIMADVKLNSATGIDCVIMPEFEGSDHCPVKASFSLTISPHGKPPPLCSKYLPEFSGKQQKLSAFFSKKSDTKGDLCSQTSSSSQSSEGSLTASESISSNEGITIKGNLKRKLPDSCNKAQGKQPRIQDKKKSLQKQGSLLSFLNKPKLVSGNNAVRDQQDLIDARKVCEDSEKKEFQMETPENVLLASNTTMSSEQKEKKSKAASTWKSLLKGPPAAPNCKGHKEPCLLRTVKKESLNKGRQFWVCNRPEGHKTNPEARCDTFEWVDKKKK